MTGRDRERWPRNTLPPDPDTTGSWSMHGGFDPPTDDPDLGDTAERLRLAHIDVAQQLNALVDLVGPPHPPGWYRRRYLAIGVAAGVAMFAGWWATYAGVVFYVTGGGL